MVATTKSVLIEQSLSEIALYQHVIGLFPANPMDYMGTIRLLPNLPIAAFQKFRFSPQGAVISHNLVWRACCN